MGKSPFYLLKREKQENLSIYGLLCRELEIYLSQCHCAVKLRGSCRMTNSKRVNSRHVAQGLEHHLDMVGVGGSNPLVPTNNYSAKVDFLIIEPARQLFSLGKQLHPVCLRQPQNPNFLHLKTFFLLTQ